MTFTGAKNDNRWPSYVSAFFIVLATVSMVWLTDDWVTSAPLLVFYIVLVVNTYFSVRFFSPVNARLAPIQRLVDISIIILYIGLAMSLMNPEHFLVLGAAMFVVAALKYVLMKRLVRDTTTLDRKIRIDILGAMACAMALILIRANGYSLLITWMLAIANAAVNINVLWWHPMYRHVEVKQPRQ